MGINRRRRRIVTIGLALTVLLVVGVGVALHIRIVHTGKQANAPQGVDVIGMNRVRPPTMEDRVGFVLLQQPDLDAVAARELIAESDHIVDDLAARGIDDVDHQLRHEIARIEVSEEEMRAYFDEHRGHFGDRSFEESRGALLRLVQIRKLRESYE